MDPSHAYMLGDDYCCSQVGQICIYQQGVHASCKATAIGPTV